MKYSTTPDGRYFVVAGRLWRMADPGLAHDERDRLVGRLMDGRRAVRQAMKLADPDAERAARGEVDIAKTALGERGPVWWTDGAPDYNRRMAMNTPYAEWFASLNETNSPPGDRPPNRRSAPTR